VAHVPSLYDLAQFGYSQHDFDGCAIPTFLVQWGGLSMVRRVWCLSSILCMFLSGAAALRAQNAGFVYVASLGEPGNVSAYAIDATTGALTPVSGSPFPAGLNSRSVAVDPTGHFAYVVNGSSALDFSGSISAYTIDPETGALTQVPGSPVPVGGQPSSVAADPTGEFVYVAGGPGAGPRGGVSGYRIDKKSGALEPVSGVSRVTGHL